MWTADEKTQLREQLAGMLRELEHVRGDLKREINAPMGAEVGDPAAEPMDQAELSHRHADEDVAMRLLSVEGHLQREIVDALARIDQGRFGNCERCNAHIAKNRLKALPYARYCIDCARSESKS
ncbi:MAG: TraR/DksA C4-type zinc finger protein [Gemmataceae bacterium]|nr:TraR/DksA C4-type zinc finger protein [Gemmataceae bacterium]